MVGDCAFVVLAAGKGTRLRSERAKVLHQAGGLPLLSHVLRALEPLSRDRVWVVVGHQAGVVRQLSESFQARTVLQQPQKGTGHAVARALMALPHRFRHLVVLPGDAPLLRTQTLRTLERMHVDSAAAATLLTARLVAPHGYGRIVRDAGGDVEAIVEQSALRGEQGGLGEVNSGVYGFNRKRLAGALGRLDRKNVHGEYYLTDTIALLRQAGETIATCTTDDPEEILGVNTAAELARADSILRRRKAEMLMSAGVTLYQPETQAIDPDVIVGADTIVERGVELRGSTRVGRRCRIGAYSILENARLADEVTVRPHCLVLSSRLGAGVTVGPFAHLRDGAEIRRRARIGNYVEVKKSVVGEGAKAQHLTYLGDATIGRDTNIGAGTITCNYDGVHKNPTTIGDEVFIGSGTELVAPVRVGSGAYVAAGSTVTGDVPAHALAIARARQTNKPGWARTRRQKLAAAKASANGQPEKHRRASRRAARKKRTRTRRKPPKHLRR